MQFDMLYESQRPFTGASVDWNSLYKETLFTEGFAPATLRGHDHGERAARQRKGEATSAEGDRV